LDNIITIGIDTSPRYEYKLIEETDTYKIERDEWGVTKKNFIPISSTPHYLDCIIKDPQTWQEAKKRMTPVIALIGNALENIINSGVNQVHGLWLLLGLAMI
jgi:hypothetical protein